MYERLKKKHGNTKKKRDYGEEEGKKNNKQTEIPRKSEFVVEEMKGENTEIQEKASLRS